MATPAGVRPAPSASVRCVPLPVSDVHPTRIEVLREPGLPPGVLLVRTADGTVGRSADADLDETIEALTGESHARAGLLAALVWAELG